MTRKEQLKWWIDRINAKLAFNNNKYFLRLGSENGLYVVFMSKVGESSNEKSLSRRSYKETKLFLEAYDEGMNILDPQNIAN